VSFRTSTHDRIPYIGAVDPRYPGLFVTVGHGSRGLLSSMVGGELLADLVEGGRWSGADTVRTRVDPGRRRRQLESTRGEGLLH
jgi:glycine/D-amino acid oxidase-like deaminating enzyme